MKLLEGRERRHEDLFSGASPRPFHFILATPAPTGVEIVVKGFRKGETETRVIDTFRLPY